MNEQLCGFIIEMAWNVRSVPNNCTDLKAALVQRWNIFNLSIWWKADRRENEQKTCWWKSHLVVAGNYLLLPTISQIWVFILTQSLSESQIFLDS